MLLNDCTTLEWNLKKNQKRHPICSLLIRDLYKIRRKNVEGTLLIWKLSFDHWLNSKIFEINKFNKTSKKNHFVLFLSTSSKVLI